MHPRQILIACGLLIWALFAVAAETAANIVFSSGAARVLAADGSERPASQGGELHSGDTLETRDGRVQLRFRDGASMSLQPETRFRVDQYVFSGGQKAAESDRSFFSLLRGGFRTLSGLIGKERRDQYRVETSVATIGIRGTGYSASLNNQDVLRVRTATGLVVVCNQGGCVEVPAGQEAEAGRRDERPRLLAAVPTQGVGTPGVEAPPIRQETVPGQPAPPVQPGPNSPGQYQPGPYQTGPYPGGGYQTGQQPGGPVR